VLSLCDTAMTAPDSLTAWKAELLRELYVRASERLATEGPSPDPRREATAAGPPPARATGEMDPGIAGSIAAGLDPRFAAQLTAEQAARHVRLAAHVQGHGAAVGLAVTALPTPGVGEIAVVAPDVHGVLAAITGVLAAHRVDVLGAVVGRAVTPDGALALDLLSCAARPARRSPPAIRGGSASRMTSPSCARAGRRPRARWPRW
jgi:UTP:GlnB (protein PII) uridylyltransferase